MVAFTLEKILKKYIVILSCFVVGINIIWMERIAANAIGVSLPPLAIVSSTQYKKAINIVEKINYLPFSYSRDGCYARALYMAMELAIQGIPSSSRYVYGELHPQLGESGNNLLWRFHVAIMIKVGREGTPMILDPSMPIYRDGIARIIIPYSVWRRRLNARSSVQQVFLITPGTYYSSSPIPTRTSARLIENFTQLPKFKLADIFDAYSLMHQYIGYENNLSDLEVGNKRQRLLHRTVKLIEHLFIVRKIDYKMDFLSKSQSVRAMLNPDTSHRILMEELIRTSFARVLVKFSFRTCKIASRESSRRFTIYNYVIGQNHSGEERIEWVQLDPNTNNIIKRYANSNELFNDLFIDDSIIRDCLIEYLSYNQNN